MWNRFKRLAKSFTARGETGDFPSDNMLYSSDQLRHKLRHAEHLLKDFDRRVRLVESEREEVTREINQIDGEVRALVITGQDEQAKKLIEKISFLRLRLEDVEARLALVRQGQAKMRSTRDTLAARLEIEESLGPE